MEYDMTHIMYGNNNNTNIAQGLRASFWHANRKKITFHWTNFWQVSRK